MLWYRKNYPLFGGFKVYTVYMQLVHSALSVIRYIGVRYSECPLNEVPLFNFLAFLYIQ